MRCGTMLAFLFTFGALIMSEMATTQAADEKADKKAAQEKKAADLKAAAAKKFADKYPIVCKVRVWNKKQNFFLNEGTVRMRFQEATFKGVTRQYFYVQAGKVVATTKPEAGSLITDDKGAVWVVKRLLNGSGEYQIHVEKKP